MEKSFHLLSDHEAATLFGLHDEHLKLIEAEFGVKTLSRGQELTVSGPEAGVGKVSRLVEQLLGLIRSGQYLRRHEVVYAIRAIEQNEKLDLQPIYSDRIEVLSKRQFITPKTATQKEYLDAIRKYDIVFALGVAGTGKSYLAMAMAVHALKRQEVSRIILTRPAVEAGESLGFLPGTFEEKVNPYLRPLYDALYEMMDVDRIQKNLERGVLEVAPLAYMRGRAQPTFSPVLTPAGCVPIGNLRAGDAVIGSNGAPTRVAGVYPQGRKEIFRITMQDGASTLCTADHLWAVYTRDDRRRNKGFRILETREMSGRLRCAQHHRYELPLISAPVQFPSRSVPMDPYAIGLLLGDGCLTGSTTPTFGTSDPELVNALQGVPEGAKVIWKSGADDALRNADGGHGGVIAADPVTAILRELGLCGTRSSTKFVPRAYLYNSADVRLAVLQGLLDADGGPVVQVGRTCRIHYCTTSQQLRDDVLFLVRSLGGIVYASRGAAEGRPPGRVRGREVRYSSDAYVLDIRLPEPTRPFRLSRKLERYRQTGGGHPARYIDGIERIGEHEAVCIRVEAPDSLYVTDDFIVTHNTLNDSFVILDEAQNCTPEQMKMFLTRLGFDSKAVITGDITQSDLPQGRLSGLAEAWKILQGIEGIGFVEFKDSDVVRHELVQKIVRAYEEKSGNSRKGTDAG